MLAAFVAVAVVYLVALNWNLAERISLLTSNYEFMQLDELPLAVFAAALALAWFSRRRMADLEAEITRRVAAEQQLAALLAENRALAQHARQAQEDERRRMAREIHDEIGQYLTAIRLSAAMLPGERDSTVAEQAARISGHAEHIQLTVRDLLHQLRPVALDEYGLVDALRCLVEMWREQNPEVVCALELGVDDSALDDRVSITVYRLVQEALTNVARHAGAHHVWLDMALAALGGKPCLEVTIRDDGVGFTQLPQRPCFGLVGMRERVEGVGGRFEIRSAFDAGVTIFAVIPLGA